MTTLSELFGESPHEFRRRFSALTSFAMALVLLGLPYVPAEYTLLRSVAVAVLVVDGLVKLFDVRQYRDYVSAAYSLMLFAVSVSFFHIFGEPWSYVFGAMWLLDAVLKLIPGDQRLPVFGDENMFRHWYSALATTLLGLSVLLGVVVFDSPLITAALGVVILADGVVKLEYVSMS